jgi:hypothetical protein
VNITAYSTSNLNNQLVEFVIFTCAKILIQVNVAFVEFSFVEERNGTAVPFLNEINIKFCPF